ncbi:hypothetical protein [Luteibacter sp.]|jgi:hypothetical protein|uniref:hypothetical protein n=1 Tax=Luteibacter sp. TaxID=1886636 RepID=UPI002F416C6E
MAEEESRSALLILDVFNTFQFPGGWAERSERTLAHLWETFDIESPLSAELQSR